MSQTLIKLVSTLQVIAARLSTGAELPLRRHISKTGNPFHATLSTKKNGEKYYNMMYGVNVAPAVIGGSLPEWAELPDGTKVTLTAGVNQSGNPQVKGSAKVLVDGQEKVFDLRISQTKDGNYNVNGSIHAVGGGGGNSVADTL